MEVAASSQQQTCKLRLTLSESTTRSGLRLASRATSGITANILTLLLPAAFPRATNSILTYKVGRAKRWNKGNRVPITMSGFTKEQYIGVMKMPDLDTRA